MAFNEQIDMAPQEDGAPVSDAQKVVPRDRPEPSPARAAQVKKLLANIESGKKYHKKAFDRITHDIKFAANLEKEQWGLGASCDKYTANLVLRHIQDRTASLYAKNPRCRARRRKRLDFQVWDGKQETLMAALQSVDAAQNALMEIPPEVMALITDLDQAKERRAMLDKVGKTLEVVFHHFLDTGEPRFKLEAKKMVKRTVTTGVGWVKLNLQRSYDKNPGVMDKIGDITQRLAVIDRLTADMADGEYDKEAAEAEELKQALAMLQAEAEILVEEGIVFTFPKTKSLILDPRTESISGFIGCNWMAEEFMMSPDEVQEFYKIDIGNDFRAYTADSDPKPIKKQDSDKKDCLAHVYEYYDKKTGVVYPICEGYPDYLKEPEPPSVKLKRFYPYYGLMFNEVEHETCIYPPSDVRLLMDAQKEYNRMREGLRQHRIANQPRTVSPKGVFDDEDKQALHTAPPNSNTELNIPPGTEISKQIMAIPTVNIDPNMYEVNTVFVDIERSTGQQQANFGGTSDATATEVSVAEGSRVSTMSSAVDDLDEMLTDIARDSGQVILLEMSPEIVQKIAGPGASFPQLTRAEIADELYLEIIAGSSGRPNKAQDLANLERATPLLTQVPGISPAYVGRKIVETLDDAIDLEEAIIDGMPSITALNAMAKPQAGAAGAKPAGADKGKPGEPDQQGQAGADNAERSPSQPQGPQPAYPAAA